MEELFSQSSDRLTDMTTNPPEGKPDGIYKYPGVDAYYKKQNGKWYKKIGDSDYTELTQGNVDERIKQLELNATPLNPDKKIKSIVKKALDSEVNNENIATYDYEGNLVVPQYKTIGKDTDYSKYQKINGEWYSGNGDIFTDYPGKEGKAYRYNDGKWYEYLSTISGDKGDISELKKPIKDPLRIDALNKRYKKQGGPEKGVFVGYPGKEENQYKIQRDKWLRKTPESDTWVTVTNEGSINALNNYFKKDISKIDSESEISKLKIDNNYSLLFNNNIKNINANFIGNEEEEVVSKLKKMFPSKYGWNFEESSAGDRVTVTAPNGKTEEFILDNWTWDDDKLNANNMIGWMQANNLNPSEKEAFDKYKSATDLPDRQVKFTHGGEIDVTPIKFYQTESEKKSINDWMPIKAKKVADIYDMYSEYIDTNGEGLNKGEIQRARAALGALSNDKQEIKQINNYQNDIKNNIKSYKEKINQTEDYLNLINEKYKNGEISYEEYKSIYSSQQEELINQQKEINNKIKTSDLLVRSSNRAVAENALAQEVMGSLGGGLALSAIKGFFSPVRLLLGATGSDMSSKEYHKFITDIISPVWNFKTSLEYLRSQENPDLYQAGFSVAESLGAMAPIALTGGSTLLGESILAKGTMGAVSFYPMSYYEMKDELENVKIPEEDKIALASIYGVVSSALESIGMEYAMGKVNTSIGSAIKRNILKNVLSKTIPANAPKEYIDALVRTETKAYISSLGLDLMGASGVEGLTEGLQSMTGAGINELYDIANKTNFFNKKGFEGVVKNALSESYLGAIGGGMVHSVYIASDAINRNIAINSETMRLLMLASKTNGMTDALMTNLKTDLLNGRITKEEAEEISNNFNIIKGNLNQIPDNLTEEAKSVSLSLMLERDKLNKEIEGKDPNLVKPQSDRITEINNRLQELSKENAVQEPSTEGVLPRQPETTGETGGEREGMGQGVQGEEVAKEGVEQAPIESKVQEIIPGEKATVADVDIVYPTEPQAEERKAFRSTSEYVENVSKELPIEDVETLTKELDGDFGLLTAENPMAQPLTEEENKQLNQKAEEWLNKKGYKPRRVTGKYGQAENSFFVPNLTRQDAIEFAKQFNQESVAHSDGLVYQDGSMNPRVKANDNLSFTESYSPESDFVSVVNTKDGLKTFSIGYNFDEKVMPEQQAATQISEVTITPETSQTVTERINKETDTKRKKVFTAVQKVLSAIPNAKIILHDNTDTFVDGVAKSAGITNDEAISQGVNNNRGSYVNGDIHINLETAGVTTVFHEAFHDLLAKKGMENNALLDMAKGLKSVISDKALKTRLDKFVSNYEQGERAEEYTTELGAIMAEAQKELSTTKFQQFKTLVNKIAKKLGMPVVFSAASTAQDAVDFMNSMAGKLGKGEQIEVGEAIKVDTNELSIKAEKIGDFDVSYFEDADDYKKLVENGSVENNYDINKIAGEVVAIHQPDNMFVGDLNYKGKNIFKGLGGVFYTLITGNVWASGAENSAKSLANLINKSLKESTDGVGRLVLVRGTDSKMISSTEGVKAAMSVIELLVDKGLISRSEFRSSLIRAGKKFNIDFSGKDSSAAIHKDIKEKFMDVKNSTFQKRGDFFDEVINDLSKTSKSASENIDGIRKELGSKRKISFSKDGIRDSIGYILTERLLKDLPTSHVYAIIEVTEPVTYEERKGHDSYPWVLKSKSKPKLKLLSDRGHAVKDGVFEMIDGSEVSQAKLGLAQRGMGTAKISQQPSKIKAQKLAPNGKPSNLNDVQWEQVRTPAFKKWFGDWENDPANASKVVDENGEPLVVYHGTYLYKGYYTEFNNISYFTDNKNTAEEYPIDSYIFYKKFDEYFDDFGLDENDINKLKKYGYDVEKLKSGNIMVREDDWSTIWKDYDPSKLFVYECFLNLRNPQIIENAEDFDITYITDSSDKRIENSKFENYDSIIGIYPYKWFSQDKINYHRGIIGDFKKEKHFVTFNSNQIKLADGTNTTFDAKNPSIKAQKQSKEDAIQDAKDKYELSVEKRGKDHKTGVTAAIADLQKSDWYRDADDIQREEAVREIKNFFGEKIKSAPSVAKVTGKTKQTAFVSDLAAAIRDQIKIQARSSRETAKNINDRRKALGTAIKEVVSKYKGKITERQLKSINTRIANVNLFNQEMVERVIDYVNKVMNNAEYATKVNNAFAERRAIRRMMKSGNMAETVAVAKEFTQIDPSMVDDIDAYLEMAQKIRGAVKSSRRVGETVSLKQIVNFGEAYEYIKPVLDAQEESMKNMLLAEHNDLVESGVISKDMTLKDINKILNKIRLDEKVDSNEEESAREFLKQRLESIKSIVSIVAKGYNPLTGEVMDISDRNKQMIAKVVKSDMNNMSTKQMTEMVDSLSNFLENGAVGGIETAYNTYVGEENAASLEKQGVVAKRLKLYLNPELGQLHGEEVTPLVELFNRMFLGVTKGIDVMTDSGFADVILGANKARRQVKEIQDNYVKKFGKIKNFFQIENVYERGAIAFLKRNLIGSDIEVKSEFNRRVDWLFESAERLKNGTQREQKMAEVYSKVFDKLDVKSRDLNKIISKANPTNVAAVDWWINEWSTHYSDLSDISRSVYNTILGKDINYTPDRLKTTSEGSSQTINDKILESKSAFLMNTDAITDTNESGVMIASVRPKIEKTKGRYVSLDFDVNNIESLTGALVDINTAGAIRQVSSFFGSKSFKSIVPSAEDRTMLNERVNKYIRRAKNKLSVSSDFFNWMDQKTNIVASLSTAFGLGGIFQAPKQTISVALSTLLQTKTNFNVYAGESFNKWLNTTGATVSNRGQESRTELESANKKLQSFNGTLSQAIHEIKKLSQWQLKLFLSMPDVFVARAAFKSYYEQYLTKNGYDVSKINWDTWNDTIKKEGIEELNKKAIIYADAMTSRQQNVSDERLAGEFLANEDAARKTIRKMFLPFGSFSINQRARFVADINTLVRFNISSKEDIAIAINSIAGTMVEQIIFQAQNLGIGMLLYSIAQSLAGHDDDDDEWKKRIVNATKYPLRSLFADFVSPNPILDEPIILGADQLLGMMDAPSDGEIKQAIEDEQELRIATGKKPMTESQINKFKEEYIKENTYQLSYNFTNEDEGKYGLYSMSFDTYRKLYKNYELANNGTFIKENYGKETTMYLTDKDKSLAKYVYYILEVPYATGKALKEMGQVANKTYSIIKKRALTEDQYEVYKEFKKEFKREPQEWEINMIKSSKSPKYSFGAMRYVQDFGGLSNQQGKEYAKVFEKTGMVLPPAVFDMIKQGKSSDKAFQKYKQEMKKELNTDVSERVFN